VGAPTQISCLGMINRSGRQQASHPRQDLAMRLLASHDLDLMPEHLANDSVKAQIRSQMEEIRTVAT